MINYETLSIQWLGHAGFLIKSETDKKIVIDPFKIEKHAEPADIVISTHEHFDHCNPEDLKKFINEDSEIVAIPLAKKSVENIGAKKVHLVKPGDHLEISGVKLSFISAYNINKFRSPGQPFHPKEDNKIGVIVDIEGTTIYHAGDSDCTTEMKDVKTDVALLPVSGTYVMTVDEALEAVQAIQPKLAIPMHFGKIVGDLDMAKEFKEKASCPVEIPEV
ncbi:MAG: MBL fold metallo-hydrolase [Candidatus Hodarchaeales archaeon]|jgi:L-ascorbate metabolism protein UlaG (beta-lactamase superfamily)